jgi:endonuclease/exonuclease/phosphatase (EEP) superfamily protein YafD
MKYDDRGRSGRSRLLLGLLAACLLPALVAAGATGAAADETEQPPPVGPTAANVRFVTYNAGAEVSVPKAMADMKRIMAEQPDVIALQEFASWKKREKVRTTYADCKTCLYDSWIPIPAVQGGTPILWRSDRFELVQKAWTQVTEDTYVGPKGAGPSTIRAKYIVWVRLRELSTGRQIFVLNNHFVPTVQGTNGGSNSNRKRVELYRAHMQGLVSMIQGIQAQKRLVFVTGDFNVNYRKDRVVQDTAFPYANLGAVNVRSSYYALGEPGTGTHVLSNGFAQRLIDYVHFWDRKKLVVPQAQRILLGLNSDHRPLVVDFKLMGKGCWVRGEPIC